MGHPFDDSLPKALDSEVEASAEPESEEVECRSQVVDAALHGRRLDKALVAMVPELSRSYLQRLIDRGCVKVDGKPASWQAMVEKATSRRI